MNPSDDDLREFFAELKLRDEQTVPPPFPGLPARPTQGKWRYLVPLAAAATVLLVLTRWSTGAAPPSEAHDQVIVISLERTTAAPTEILLEDPESVYSWESSSNSLIADF